VNESTPIPIALSISTLGRPEGLRATLESLAAQRPAAGGVEFDLRAVVANNDPDDPRPAAVATEVVEATGLPIEVRHEPRRGIAPPRNLGLATAIELVGPNGLVGFIDDDEIAPPGWLAELLRVKAAFGAEIVTGPVEPEFEEAPPTWIVDGGFFARARRPTGARLPYAFTNNIVFDASLPARLDRWFDDSFLRIGEDHHFFERLARTGAAIVWADEAPVVERIPPRRANETWIVERFRTVGRCMPMIVRDLRGGPHALAMSTAKAMVWIPLGLSTTVAGLLSGTATRVRGRAWTAYGTGLLEGAWSPGRAGRPRTDDR
jgi:succinoglycan biosynthesis protein ExoM